MTQSPSARRNESATAPTDWARCDDAALLTGCRARREGAWRELVTRYRRLVYSVPRRYGLDRDAADEVFQEVFAVLVRRLPDVRNPRGLPKWLLTTTQRTCRAVSRARKSAATLAAAAEPALRPDDPPPDLLAAWERRQTVRQALRQLGGPCEELLTALYGGSGDPTYERIADRLGIPVGSIGPTRARCLRKLLAIMRKIDGRRPADEHAHSSE